MKVFFVPFQFFDEKEHLVSFLNLEKKRFHFAIQLTSDNVVKMIDDALFDGK